MEHTSTFSTANYFGNYTHQRSKISIAEQRWPATGSKGFELHFYYLFIKWKGIRLILIFKTFLDGHYVHSYKILLQSEHIPILKLSVINDDNNIKIYKIEKAFVYTSIYSLDAFTLSDAHIPVA